MAYGITYVGSKNKIIKNIVDILPKGKRLIDLFGGGGSLEHYVFEKEIDKWDTIAYNDNGLIFKLLVDAINGKYDSPQNWRFIHKDEFKEKRETDPYVKYIYSFCTNGQDYAFNPIVEEITENIHYYLIGKKQSFKLTYTISCESVNYLNDLDLRLKFLKTKSVENKDLIIKDFGKLVFDNVYKKTTHISRLKRLSQMSFLKKYVEIGELKLSKNDYRNFEFKDGDIVYADPPYSTYDSLKRNPYQQLFNYSEFLDWVDKQNVPIFFSSYYFEDDRFERVWSKNITKTYRNLGEKQKDSECLYCNKFAKSLIK